MPDVVDKATRSRMMSGIRGKDTKPEVVLRKSLHSLGFRYRLHAKGLPGRPDIVLPKYYAVVFAHGCFWHRHHGCRLAATPATRPEFWREKLDGNRARDLRTTAALRAAGWRVAVVWECAQRTMPPDDVAERVAAWLRSDEPIFDLPGTDRPMPALDVAPPDRPAD